MINDHSGGTALGLRAFARIIDNKRIEMRDRRQRDFGKTLIRQGQRLARQPFQIAMLAKMHNGMGIERVAQPGIKGEIAMRRHQIGVVIAGQRIDVITARRLNTDDHIAKTMDRQNEPALLDKGIAQRIAPARPDPFLYDRRQIRKIGLVGSNIIGHFTLPDPGGIGRTGQQQGHQLL